MPDAVIKSLRYDFTESEIHDLSMELANKTKAYRKVADEKKEANVKFNASLKGIKADCDLLSNQVSDGYEYRDISCEVEYHKPSQGQMTVTRTDTGEVFIQQMTEEDWNLFNQV
jgi:hypothetical protein